jgi:hypothetical protein
VQTAARKRCQLSDGETGLSETLSELDGAAGYARMRALCMQLGSEVRLDMEIHKQNIFPRYPPAATAAHLQGTPCCARLIFLPPPCIPQFLLDACQYFVPECTL